MVLVRVEERLEGEEAILTAKGGGATKLESCPVEFMETEGTAIHDGGENLAADVHQHNTAPFVGIREIARFRNRDALASMPSFIVGIAFKKGSNVFMNSLSGRSVLCFVRFGGNTIQAWALSILQLVDGSINFVEGDGGVDVMKSWALGDVSKDGWVDWAVVVENSLEMRTKHLHIFFSIGCRSSICHFHCHVHLFCVVSS